jgi:hypothetical protein
MLRIEKTAETKTHVRYDLTGKISAEHLEELRRLLAEAVASGRKVTFDLEGVGLVEREVVRFFSRGPGAGIELRHCPGYMREWIRCECAEGSRLP